MTASPEPLNTSTKPDLTKIDIAPLLLQVVQEIQAGNLNTETASKTATAINAIRQEAITSTSSPSDVDKLFLVRAGQLGQFLDAYAENAHFDMSLAGKLPKAKRQAEDLLILAK